MSPTDGFPASSTDPSSWGSHGQAIQASRRVGYVLGAGVGCIDLDHAILSDGNLTDGARQIVDLYAGNWIEISPSGDGLHIWGIAPPLKGVRRVWRGQAVEFYSTGRYITVTGKAFQRGNLLPL